jgi:hypothetical protein
LLRKLLLIPVHSLQTRRQQQLAPEQVSGSQEMLNWGQWENWLPVWQVVSQPH